MTAFSLVQTSRIFGVAKNRLRNGGHFTCRLHYGGSISTKGWRSRQLCQTGDVQVVLESIKK